jgi:hypothetical protein
LPADTRLYWRVRGLWEDVVVGAWSEAWAFTTGATSTAAEGEAEAPVRFALEGNYPNPFNPATTIRFALPRAGPARLAVYDVLGREVARLVDGPLADGWHAVTWQAGGAGSGVYYYCLEAGTFRQTRAMMLVK